MNRNQIKQRDEIKPILTGLTIFTGFIIGITIFNNPEIFRLEFCGSLQDFQQGPAPTVCIGPGEYLYRAITHPNYFLPASITGLIAGLIQYGDFTQHAKELLNK